MKKQLKPYIFYVGIVIFAIGLLLNFIVAESDGISQSLTSVLIGLGAGITGGGVAGILLKKTLKNNPEKVKEYEIAEKDERNVRLREKAGYSAWYISVFMLAILSLIFLIFDYKLPCFITIGALFVQILSLFVFIYIYNKSFNKFLLNSNKIASG